MDSLALGHNFGVYEEAGQPQQPTFTRQHQEYYEQNLNLINSERIDFAKSFKGIGKFTLFMCLSGGAVFLSRILPIFSFAGLFVRVVTFCFLGKEAIFNPSDKERRDFQLLLLSVTLGNLGAEWDAWLSICLAVSDFFTLYGTAIFGGLGILLVVILWLLFRWASQNQSQQIANLNTYNTSYSAEDFGHDN